MAEKKSVAKVSGMVKKKPETKQLVLSSLSSHPKLYSVTVLLETGATFKTFSARDHGDKPIRSSFDVAALPWNRVGIGAVSGRDASVTKFRKRQGGMSYAGAIAMTKEVN